MKNMNKISILAIALWLVTIGIVGYRFVSGNAEKLTDERSAITLSSSQKVNVLSEMRSMLLSVQGIVDGLEEGNMKVVTEAANESGTEHMVDTDPALMLKLPLAFKKMGVGVHKYFDQISIAAKTGASKEKIISMLNTQLKTCVSCHATYQLKIE